MNDQVLNPEPLNHTELVELARMNELPRASKMVPREILADHLMALEPIDSRNPMRITAARLSGWLVKWWVRLRDTAPKKCCPNCPGCSDLQVLDCYQANRYKMETS